MSGPDPHPDRSTDPSRPGTVYRSRPRLLRLGRGRRPLPFSRSARRPADPPPYPPPTGAPEASQHPTQYPAQQNYPGQQYPTQQYPTQQYPGQQYPGQQYPGQQHPGQQHASGEPPYGPPTGRMRRRRRRWPWILALVLVLVLLVVYPLLLGLQAWSNLGRTNAMPTSGRPAATPGRTFLVVGSDSRQDLTRAERARLGTGQAAGQRTDTLMLLHVPSGGGPTVLVSVPRDSYVAIPGHGKNKINAAYAFGGPQLLVRTVEQATGLRIDEYVETGLGGYANLVDAVGGVNVCVKKAIKDAKAHIDLRAGCQTLNGQQALGYARARYSDPRGDLGRVERQRQVLAAIAGKTLSPSVLLLPWRAFPASRAGGHALTVDNGTSPYGLEQFIMAMRTVSGGNGLSLTVPTNGTITTAAAGEALRWDTAKADQLFKDLRSDHTEAITGLAEDQKKKAA